MSGKIRMTPDQAKGRAREIDGKKQEVEQIVKKLHNIVVNQLAQEWEGEAQKAFSDQFTKLENSVMKQFTELLGDISKQLTSVAQAMQEADQQIASQIRK